MTDRNRTREATRHIDPTIKLQTNHVRIAGAWIDLEARLASRGNGQNEKVSGTTNPSLIINMHVSGVIAEVLNDTWFAVRVIIAETNSTPPTPTTSLPVTLTWIATWRASWLANHRDLGEAILTDWARNERRVANAAYADPVRLIPVGVKCPEHTADEFGQRVRCAGQLAAPLDPDKYGQMPDLVCSHDPLHVISPIDWQRAYRKAHGDTTRLVELLTRHTA